MNHTARRVKADDPAQLKKFTRALSIYMAEDHSGSPVVLARGARHLQCSEAPVVQPRTARAEFVQHPSTSFCGCSSGASRLSTLSY